MSIVYLHVGLPKTGTTHLQDRLWLNREAAREQAGLLYPGLTEQDHFHAAAHLQPERYLSWALPEHAGVWPRMVAEMKAWPGTSLISHELLATARPQHLATLLDDLSFADEVRVILTVRDLARQLPSVWQENIKNRRLASFDEFLASVAVHAPDGETTDSPAAGEAGGEAGAADEEPFWEFQNYPAVVAAWSRLLPADRIHLVTVPAEGAGAPGDGVWERFLRVLDTDPALLPLRAERHNASLSAPQTEFLRRLNTRIRPGDLEWRRYEHLVKRGLIGDGLGPTTAGAPLGLTAAQRDWAAAQSERMIAAVAGTGCSITGTLDDLRVRPDTAAAESAPPTTEELLDAGLDALAHWITRMSDPFPAPPPRSRAGAAAGRIKRGVVGLPERFRR